MADIILRSDQLGPLTSEQVDQNFINLNIEVGQKLDSIDYTAADILSKLLTVDGAASGLDADYLDGLNGHSTLPTSTDKSSVVIRDASGNFEANSITSNLIGNVTGNVTGTLTGNASTATTLQTARNINGVAFNGSADITVLDNTKLSLTGGTLSGFLTLHASPTAPMHAATKDYVDVYGVPKGAIMMWYGTTLPTGWALCDGTVQNGVQTPDLRNKFIYGSNTLSDNGNTGGSTSKATDIGGSHSHGGVTGEHALTVAQLPAHAHSLASVIGIQPGGGVARHEAFQSNSITVTATGSVGSGQTHSHTIATHTGHTHNISNILPPYVQIAFIIKVV